MSFVQNGEILVKIGARGELRGRCHEWNEVCFGNVRQIFVMHGNAAVNSIQIAYDFNGMLVLSHRRGGDGDKFDCINMEPWETLTAINGHYGAIDDNRMTVVSSLTLTTNRATYGPFGKEEGTQFSFRFQSGVTFGGFHGRSGSGYLRALGIFVKSEARRHFKPDTARRKTLPALCAAPDDSEKELDVRH